MKIYENSRKILKDIIAKEGLREAEDFGYFDAIQSIILKEDSSPWTDVLNGVSDVFPDQSIKVLNREKDPDKYKSHIDDNFPQLENINRYNCAIYREMNTIDTTKFGKKLWEITERLENVEIKVDSEVSGYEIEDGTSVVKAV